MLSNIELNGKLITCVFPKGVSAPILERLANKGITRINFSTARGNSIHDVPGRKGTLSEVEKEIFTVIAKDEEEAEDLFDYIFSEAKVHRLGGGFMYMTSLSLAAPYIIVNSTDLHKKVDAQEPASQEASLKAEPQSE